MELLGLIFRSILGFSIVIGLLVMIYKRDAVDWEKLHDAYGRNWRPPIEKKSFQTLILYSEGRLAKSYKGLLTIGLYEDGIALRPFIGLMPFQYPIFVPYADIEGWQQKWFIDAKSMELVFRRVPDLRMIMPSTQVDWILSRAGGAAHISDEGPPHGGRPNVTFALAIISGVMAVFLIGWIVLNGLAASAT